MISKIIELKLYRSMLKAREKIYRKEISTVKIKLVWVFVGSVRLLMALIL